LITLTAQCIVIIALLAAGISYLKLKGFRDANLATIQHLQLCRNAAIELELAPSLHNLITSNDKDCDQMIEAEQLSKERQANKANRYCLVWARSGFGTITGCSKVLDRNSDQSAADEGAL
jgi:hypothetical protein